jgi:hypothetical protein
MNSNKKLPSQASYEELLSALDIEESPEVINTTEEILEFQNNVIPFLSYYNIIPGDKPVTKQLLYKLYKHHVDDPADKLSFHRTVGEYLSNYSNRSGRFYQINIDQFKISKHLFDLFKENKVDKTKSLSWRKRFDTFLATKKITAGSTWVAGYVIFEIYLDFCRDRKKRASFSYDSFHRMLKEYFESKRKSSNRSLWFKVNKETSVYFTQEQIDEIKARRSKKKG